MATTNTYGRQVVVPLTNKSGGSVAAGDVVVIDTTNNDAFTTSTAGAVTGGVGIAQETIASNASGRVLLSGYAALVNTSASVTRGNFGKTHTVVKQAVDAGATRGPGTFCQFLTGGTTPDAIVYPVDLLGSSLSNPMTTKGDVILGDTGGTPTRLGAGTSGYVLTSAGAAAFPTWSAAAGGGTRPLVDPTTQSWSWLNQGGATITTQGKALRLESVAEAADNWHFRVKTVPSKPYSVIVHILGTMMPLNYAGISIGWLRTSDNHFAIFDQRGDTTNKAFFIESSYSTAPWAVTNNYTTLAQPFIWEWVKITDDVTNRTVSVSRDGYNWIQFHSVATNDQITPDRLVFGIESRNATYGIGLYLDSWEEA